jgi:hypothetical protein
MAPLIRTLPLRCFAALLACFAAAQPASAAEGAARQHEVHAVFLLNLARFVRWPDPTFKSDSEPLVIGLLQNDPMLATLRETVRGEKIGNHPVEVRSAQVAGELTTCHVVYFSKTTLASAVQMLVPLRQKPILTVSDADGFLSLGGLVQLYARGAQVRIRLNLKDLQRANFTASSQLLRVAEVSSD